MHALKVNEKINRKKIIPILLRTAEFMVICGSFLKAIVKMWFGTKNELFCVTHIFNGLATEDE